MYSSIGGIQVQGTLILFHGVLELGLLHEDAAQGEVVLTDFRIEFYGPLDVAKGQRAHVFLLVNQTELIVGIGVA